MYATSIVSAAESVGDAECYGATHATGAPDVPSGTCDMDCKAYLPSPSEAVPHHLTVQFDWHLSLTALRIYEVHGAPFVSKVTL